MRSSAMVGLVVIMACASSGVPQADVGTPGGGDRSSSVTHVMMGGDGVSPTDISADAQNNSMASWHDVAAPEATVWQTLPAVYQKLGLAITRYDTAAHIIEGQRLRSHGRFGGKDLTSLMDCGDVAGMPNASRFDVNILTRTLVKGTGATSSVASTVSATSKPGGVSGVAMPCVVNSSAGDQIAAALNSALGTK